MNLLEYLKDRLRQYNELIERSKYTGNDSTYYEAVAVAEELEHIINYIEKTQ